MIRCGLAIIGTVLAVSLSAGKDEASGKDLEALQGTWQGWVVEGKGKRQDDGFVHLRIVVKDNMIRATGMGGMKEGPLGEGTFKLSLQKDRKFIDAVRTSMPAKGKTYLGIYEVDGDVFKWCVANPGLDRPAEFLTRKGQFLMILKKQ